MPSQWVRDLVVGEHYHLWARAVTDIKAQLVELTPVLKPVAGCLKSRLMFC
jgi:hypothetical protein